MKVAIIGGSVAGLASALALAEAGHDCLVVERDRQRPPDTPVEAFETWRRPGVPQMRHSHAFLARLHNLLRDRHPSVLARLRNAGAEEIPFRELLGPEIDDPSPTKGDEDLVLLASRRVTFEWALRQEAEANPNIRFAWGERVLGLLREEGRPRVIGLRTSRDPVRRADLVVDASGRYTRVAQWLRAANLPEPRLERHDCGIFYCTRFFSSGDDFRGPKRDLAIAADLGFVKYAVFHGDAGIFSVTLAASPEDEALRGLLRPEGFERACRALPSVARFTQGGTPLGEARAIAGLESSRRRFPDTAPEGLALVGDAALHTNPLYGRGCTMAFIHANLLAESLGPASEGEWAQRLGAAVERQLDPWYDLGLSQDRGAIATAKAHRDGRELSETRPDGKLDPRGYMRGLIRDGVLPAMRRDAVVARRGFRSFHMLDEPGGMMKDPDILQRILVHYRKRDGQSPETGLRRGELVEALTRTREESLRR